MYPSRGLYWISISLSLYPFLAVNYWFYGRESSSSVSLFTFVSWSTDTQIQSDFYIYFFIKEQNVPKMNINLYREKLGLQLGLQISILKEYTIISNFKKILIQLITKNNKK